MTVTGTSLDSAGNVCYVVLLFHEEISFLVDVVSFVAILVN